MPHTESINTLAHNLSLITGPAGIGDDATVQQLAALECTYVYLLTKWTRINDSWQTASVDIADSIERVYRLGVGFLIEFLPEFKDAVYEANMLTVDYAEL